MKTILMMAAVLAVAPLAAQSAVPAANAAPPAPVEFPATPAGAAARGLMDAVNAGDDAALREWAGRMLPEQGWMGWTPERSVAAFVRLREQSGGVDPVRLMDRGDPNYIGVIFRARNGAGRVGVEFGVNAADGRMAYVELHTMSAPGPRPELPSGPVADDSVASGVRAHVERRAAADRFSGVFLLARGDRVLVHRAYGMADVEAGRPNTLDTRIGSGSVPKMITAVAVAQLVEQGRMTFDDTLGALLPDYPNAEARRTVTVRHLLTHSSGVADPFASVAPGARYRTPGEWMAVVAEQPLAFAPGSQTQYSNGGFAVLGAIVERVSGEPFDTYVRERVFRPAGMRAADAGTYAALPRARGYSRVPEFDPLGIAPRRSNEWITGGASGEDLSGFGGIALTAEDLFRFTRALQDGRLVSPEMARTLMTGAVPVEPGATVRYGLGFYDMEWEHGVHVVGHSGGGGSSGIGADVEMVGEWTLVVMGNYDLEQDIRPLVGPVLDLLSVQEGSRGGR